MACIDDNCIKTTTPFPSCFTGDWDIHIPGNVDDDIIVKISKGNGASKTVAITLDGSGDGVIDIAGDIGADFFRAEAGWYTIRGWVDPDMIPIEFQDADGGSLTHECYRFCVVNTTVYGDTNWNPLFE